MKARTIFSAVLLSTVSSLSIGYAEDDVIVVTGLRPLNTQDVTASVTVIGQGELALRKAPNLADQLRGVPGLAVSRTGAVGGLNQIRFRGAEANHTLVLIDGIEVADPTTGETDFGLWTGLDIREVQVARGEQSALYGSDAIGGVIAVETGGDGFRAAAEGGSRDTWRGFGAYTQDFESGRIGGTLSGFTTDGVDTSGLGGEKDGSDHLSGLLRGEIELGTDWKVRGLLFSSQSTVNSDEDVDFDGRPDDTDRETESDQFLAGAALSGPAFGLDHEIRASFTEVVRENAADGSFVNETKGERTKFSWSPSLVWESGEASHRLTALIEHENETYERVDTNLIFGDPNQTQEVDMLGVAAEYRLSVGPVSLNGSLRHDDNDGLFDDATTWRLGAVYRAGAVGRFRISGGEGVKNPTFVELFGFTPGSFMGNPDLKPEDSRSVEIGWDKDFSKGSLSVTAFRADLENEIFTRFNPDFTSTALNRDGESEREGVEIAGDWSLTPSLTVYGSGASISSDSDSGEKEIRVPEWTASLGAFWESPTKAGFTIGGVLDVVGEQDDFDFGPIPAVRETLDSYVKASATLSYPVTDKVSLTLRGDDLFDEAPVDVFGFEQAGRGIYLGLAIN